MKKYKLLFLVLISALVLGLVGCKDKEISETELNLSDPNSWDKVTYKKSYNVLEEELLNYFESKKESTEPDSIFGGNILNYYYTPLTSDGEFKITLETIQYFRFSKEQIKASDLDYAEVNKLIYKEVENLKKESSENFPLPKNEHYPLTSKFIVYEYVFDAKGNKLSKDIISEKYK